jgi:hypothetical protein
MDDQHPVVFAIIFGAGIISASVIMIFSLMLLGPIGVGIILLAICLPILYSSYIQYRKDTK